MLSILIPVYNVDVRPLVHDLLQQCRQLGVVFEILLEDDASDDHFWELNRQLGVEPEVRALRNTENQGRSRVRNHLADMAQNPYLLYMDCDAGMKYPAYISQYLQYIRTYPDDRKPFVVLGGVAYREQMPDEEHRLRWKYGVRREVRTSAARNANPYQSFTPFNMLVSKSVFEICRFDESLCTYGFEDTLFGCTLQTLNIPVAHIDNELYHDGIDDNITFLRKVESSVDNLAALYKAGKVPEGFIAGSKLLTTYLRCKRVRMDGVVGFCLRTLKRPLQRLAVRSSSLLALDLLKLERLMAALAN